MRRIVTHKSSDLDAITSVWLIKRFLTNWDSASVEFVNAGDKLEGEYQQEGEAIEIVDGIETITVDTGMGALDHHQTADNNCCGASLTLDFVLTHSDSSLIKHDVRRDAVKRIVELVIDDDHFQEVYYPDSSHDIYEFGLVAVIQGFKLENQKDDGALVEFMMICLDSVLQNLEKKIWAENEIKEKGVEFESEWGKAMAVETINDEVLKLAQMQGYKLAVRKDPNGGFVRIKAMPDRRIKNRELSIKEEGNVILSENEESRSFTKVQDDNNSLGIDLTRAYEKLKELDSEASWFLHASKRMLLNGSSKNPTMKGTTLTLSQVVEVLSKS